MWKEKMQEIWKGSFTELRAAELSGSTEARHHQGHDAGPHRQLQPPLQATLPLHQLPECLSCSFISCDLKG